MLGDITVAENIYIACGYTDMRKSIDGLASIVQQQFYNRLPGSNSDGLWRVFKLNKSNQSDLPKRVIFASVKFAQSLDFTGFTGVFVV